MADPEVSPTSTSPKRTLLLKLLSNQALNSTVDKSESTSPAVVDPVVTVDSEAAEVAPEVASAAEEASEAEVAQEEAKEVEQGGPQQSYDIRETLGTGTFATVKTAINKQSGEKFAMKIIDKQKFLQNARRKDALMDEVRVLKSVSHENIIKIHDVFETSKSLYLVLELVTGGELFDRVLKGALPEATAKNMFAQMLNSIGYLHGQGIAHRDLKPENILLKSADSDIIKLSDFGLSRILDEGSFMKTVCGTPQYVAPEVLTRATKEGYGKAVDLWSLGVILYVLLSGTMPFEEDGQTTLFEKVKKGVFKFPAKQWKGVSEEAKNLIKGLLVVDPSQRLTVQQALEHPWVSELTKGSPSTPALKGDGETDKKEKSEDATDKKGESKDTPDKKESALTNDNASSTPTASATKHTPISARRRRKVGTDTPSDKNEDNAPPAKRKK